MNEQVQKYLEPYPEAIVGLYQTLRQLILDGAPCEPEETLWARLPSYYVGESFVRLIPFKDHINIEAKAMLSYKEELASYKFTPKGMMQLGVKQNVPCDVLKKVFAETLAPQAD